MAIPVVDQILSVLGPGCRDAARRQLLLGQNTINGIDFVEFEIVAGKNILHVHFLLDDSVGVAALLGDWSPIRIHGGTRITGISVASATAGAAANVIDVEVDTQGDFSPYLLSIGWVQDDAGIWRFNSDGLDRLFSVAPVNFRPGCPVDFDCAPVTDCPPPSFDEPSLDYLARDYASFRQMLMDLVAQRNPAWTEQSPADLGIALLELFAHEGDHLAYFQDAVANEAFLDTARQRISAKRHARLVDYRMHDGRNAQTYAHIAVAAAGTIPAGSQLVTRIGQSLRFDRQPGVTPPPQAVAPPGPVLNAVTDGDYRTDPALAQVSVFETAADLAADPLLNELRLHTWGNEECCLGRGTTTAHLYAIDTASNKAVRPRIAAGDLLLLEEVLGPATGAVADADPSHRAVVLVVAVNPDPSTSTTGTAADQMHDPLFLADIDQATGEPKPAVAALPPNQSLPLVEVTWRREDALTVPICLSARLAGNRLVHCVSVARGNLVVADHGRTVSGEAYSFDTPLTNSPTFRLHLAQGPLTMRCSQAGLSCDVREARPAVSLEVTHANLATESWQVRPDLLDSGEFDPHFVADVDNGGRAQLRFGDGEYGQRLIDVTRIVARYRVGNGRAGNIGAKALSHIVKPDPAPAGWPPVIAVCNPLAAQGGIDPEQIEQVRQYAPVDFRARQFRAVTEADYRDAALTIPGVADAVASFRWTGSWYTAFVGIDPVDASNVLTNTRGVTRLDPAFAQSIADHLNTYRLAGYDLEIRSARYVPIDVALQLCVKPGYFRGDVAHAVAQALNSGRTPHGVQGLFDPANFGFGQPVYLSRIYAAVEAVEGVENATVTGFHPHGRDPAGELESGRISIGPWEIARLDNDPSNKENGTLTITAGGGS